MATWYGIRLGSLIVAASARVPALISGSPNWVALRGVDQVAGQGELEAAAHRPARGPRR